MKLKSIPFLITSTFFVLYSCQSETIEKIEYTPVDGYKGKVRKITEYEYKSEIEKQEQLAIWGTNIPERITEYNEYGRQTLEIDIDIPDDTDEDFEVSIDSSFYDKRQNLVRRVQYELLVGNDKIASFISNWNIYEHQHAVYETLKSYKYDESRIVEEIAISHRNSPHGHYSNDTLRHLYTYSDEKLIEENTEHIYSYTSAKDKGMREIRRYSNTEKYSYDNNLLIAKESIDSEGNSTINTYTYKDGKLVEEERGDLILKYDENERCISRLSKTTKDISSYSEADSTYLNTSEGNDRASVTFEYPFQEKYNLSIYVGLDEGVRYKNKVASLILKYGKDSKKRFLLVSEIKDILDDIFEENRCWITDKKVEKVDEYGNAIVISENSTTLMKRNLYYSSKVYHFDYHYIRYYDIEYYE